eukprot:CAMPEP_0115567306 /NCGR_PEP_ID=MMETSP0271-20121206/104042_1 /TAXON_ID=71861 /ORGANISM="Scrippsiella trochoidea, Strain CCMP3099" /LENGTH=78 /DNA_ID=CAMNT_0003001661 /DNA_START=26 /DNA_END=263 /DNA_ORIENTATION=+
MTAPMARGLELLEEVLTRTECVPIPQIDVDLNIDHREPVPTEPSSHSRRFCDQEAKSFQAAGAEYNNVDPCSQLKRCV